MAPSFEDIDDMNRRLRHWFDAVTNVPCHGTTGRIVTEHFKEEQSQLIEHVFAGLVQMGGETLRAIGQAHARL